MESMSKDEEKTLIETFVSVTSASQEEALFFLESHNFDLDSAVTSFFENNNQQPLDAVIEDEAEEDPPAVAAAASVPRSIDPSPSPVTAMSSRADKRKKKQAAGRRGGIRTLADLNRQSGSGSDSDSDDPQEYYTGGEKSGMLVQDPNKRGHDVDAIFDQARQMGATQERFDPHPSSGSRSFTGTGRRISGETVPAAPRPPENIIHNIYFWTNGFSVDDGPLRRFDDPAYASFLESIKKSECPQELAPEDRRSTVHVNLVRRGENCPEPVKKLSSFLGVGRTLGSSSSSFTEPVAAATSSADAAATIIVDESKPTTSIQLRLADGSRTVAHFNTNHTVGDIRAFIANHAASNGRAAPANYTLQTVGFPPKQLTDATQTIEQTGLANSVVVQKL